MKRLSKELSRIKCLVIEDFGKSGTAGAIKVEYDKTKFEDILSRYTDWEVTKIFEPTQDQKTYIILKLLKNWNFDKKEGEDHTHLDMDDMFFEILPMLTDMPFDVNKEEDAEELREIIYNPPEVVAIIETEITKMIFRLMSNYIDNMKVTDHLSKPLKDAYMFELENKVLDIKETKEENMQDIEKGIAKIKEELEEE